MPYLQQTQFCISVVTHPSRSLVIVPRNRKTAPRAAYDGPGSVACHAVVPEAFPLTRQIHLSAGAVCPSPGEPIHRVPGGGAVVISQVFVHLNRDPAVRLLPSWPLLCAL